MLPIEILNVYITTKEDYTTVQPLKFNPAVTYFFTTDVYLNEKILKGNNIEIKPSLFLNRAIFENAIKILQASDYGTYTPDKLKQNINVFRKAFFKKNTQIPIGSRKYSIIDSKYVPNSLQRVRPNNKLPNNKLPINKNIIEYNIVFELTILDANTPPEVLAKAPCKIKARELNKQSTALFGVSLGLDGEIPKIKTTVPGMNPYGTNPYGTNPYGSSPYGSTSYSANPYGSSPYGSTSYSTTPYGSTSYSTSPYSTSPYSTSPYSANPYSTSPYSTNPYSANSYSANSYSANSYSANPKRAELLKTNNDIRLWFKDYASKNKADSLGQKRLDWQLYKQQRDSEGLPVLGMNDWIKKREEESLENKYKMAWIAYKDSPENIGKTLNEKTWIKDKEDEELENAVAFYSDEWLNYKSDQALLGKTPNLNEWLKDKMTKRKIQETMTRFGGKRRSTSKRSTSKRRSKRRSRSKRSSTSNSSSRSTSTSNSSSRSTSSSSSRGKRSRGKRSRGKRMSKRSRGKRRSTSTSTSTSSSSSSSSSSSIKSLKIKH